MTTAVVMDIEPAVARLGSFFADSPARTRPFHWHKEGPAAQDRMIDLIVDLEVMAHCRWQAVGRRQQTQARRDLLAALADDVAGDGVTLVVIEQGDHHTNRLQEAGVVSGEPTAM